jgi:Mn-dependent DtxR family transcriptional regulator
MVVAMIIAPGATAYQWTDRLGTMLLLAAVIGMFSAGLGFVVSFWQNWPSGPAMTVVAGGLFILSMLFSPRYGIVAAMMTKRRNVQHIAREDFLKALARKSDHKATLEQIIEETGMERGKLLAQGRRLVRAGYVENLGGGVFQLSDKGDEHAHGVLRTHRLWESLLAETGIDPAQVHHMAERLEHAHELADQIDLKLGQPEKDPHGKTIPRDSNLREDG